MTAVKLQGGEVFVLVDGSPQLVGVIGDAVVNTEDDRVIVTDLNMSSAEVTFDVDFTRLLDKIAIEVKYPHRHPGAHAPATKRSKSDRKRDKHSRWR